MKTIPKTIRDAVVLPPDEYDSLFEPMHDSELEQLMDDVGDHGVVTATTTLRQRVFLYSINTECGMDADVALEFYGLDICYPPGQRPQLYVKVLEPNNPGSRPLN